MIRRGDVLIGEEEGNVAHFTLPYTVL